MTPRTGRPKKDPDLKRTRTLRFRVTDAERAELLAACEGEGFAEWARHRLLAAARRKAAR